MNLYKQMSFQSCRKNNLKCYFRLLTYFDIFNINYTTIIHLILIYYK